MTNTKEFDCEKEVCEFIDWLSEIGKTGDCGITRVLYSECWIEAQSRLKDFMEQKGFNTYYDEVGNLFSRLEGTKYKDETILSGSHIDTVVDGGKLDGQFGIIGAAIAMEYLRETYGPPLRNIELVSLAEEEGSRFPFTFWGSKNIVGRIKENEVKYLKDAEGITFSQAMNDAGFGFKTEETIREDIKAFIELHIEQGGVLEIEGKSIGVVDHIAGQKRTIVEVEGEANHAGTTPMGYRRDAMHGVSKMIVDIMERAALYGDPLVATVGRVDVHPDTCNVVPGKVIFTIDVRHTNKDISDKFTDEIEKSIQNIAQDMDLKISIDNYMDSHPVAMDKRLIDIIEFKCKEKGIDYKVMHSGAGHDSQIFALHVPTAMIFVPSHKGISHNPLEFTEMEDLIVGVKVLVDTLYELAYK